MLCALALVLSSCASPAAEPERMGTEGRLLLAENGTALLIAEDGTPITLSVQADGNDPWAGYHSGDHIRVLHDGVNETYPAQTEAYGWERLEEGTLEDIPEETLTALEELGWAFGREAHNPAAEPQTAEDPVTDGCGGLQGGRSREGQTRKKADT